jgi:hypothetical protein
MPICGKRAQDHPAQDAAIFAMYTVKQRGKSSRALSVTHGENETERHVIKSDDGAARDMVGV